MKSPPPSFSRLYRSALRKHLSGTSGTDRKVIERLGGMARAADMPVLKLNGMHEQMLVMELLPNCPSAKRGPLIRNAGGFFAAVIQASDVAETEAREAARTTRTIKTLSGRNIELAAANRRLEEEIIEREKVEAALRKSEDQVMRSLEKSEALKEQVREMSRQILSDQEDEWRKISRELHDVIAQALLGIKARLATLKTESGMNTKSLARNISKTQKMISKSTETVHKFARELRPAVLDDLGLVPALRSFMKSFTARTGVRTHLTAFEGLEHLDTMKRTVLYRVAQEALTNVGRHAHANHADVTIRKDGRSVLMEVSDDGVSFQFQEVLSARKRKRVGLLGMRERAEMVGGSFEVKSAPGSGTRVIARIPVSKAIEARWRKIAPKMSPKEALSIP